MSRALFSDGWNSIWHFTFGFLSPSYPFILPVFIFYELKDIEKDKNTFIDITEFGLGYLVNQALEK